jgi:hypothetical protein
MGEQPFGHAKWVMACSPAASSVVGDQWRVDRIDIEPVRWVR